MRHYLPRLLPVVLAAALQVMPMLRNIVGLESQGLAPSGYAFILKIGVGAVALLGFDAVSSASSITISPASATNGVPYTGIITYNGGHAYQIQHMTLTNVCMDSPVEIIPGLYAQGNGNNTATVTGTPAAHGTYPFTIRVWNQGCSLGESDGRSTSLSVIGQPGTVTLDGLYRSYDGNAKPVIVSTTPPGLAVGVTYYVPDATGTNFFPTSNAPTNTGSYTVSATILTANYIGGTNSTLVIQNQPAVVIQPASLTNGLGGTAIFEPFVEATPPVVYQWMKNGANLSNGGHISGATSSNLTVSTVSAADVANYSLFVVNGYGSTTSSNAALAVINSPYITTQPLSQSVGVGSNVTFSVTVDGATPFAFSWGFNGAPVGSMIITNSNVSTYTLTNVQTSQAGGYFVWVTNALGQAMSTTAALTVVVSPPLITSQPANQSSPLGGSASFNVDVTGTPPFAYNWFKNGAFYTSAGSNLTFSPVASGDAAVYSVVVSNTAGYATSSNATLTVTGGPFITSQPVSQQPVQGQSVAFAVTNTGSPPIFYQWQFNGSPIPNATNNPFVIASVTTGQNGNYSVVVSNAVSSVASSNATLWVLVPPAVGLQFLSGYPLLNLSGMSGSNFTVQYSTNLGVTNWINLRSISNLSANPFQFLDPAGIVPPGRFYRAVMQ